MEDRPAAVTCGDTPCTYFDFIQMSTQNNFKFQCLTLLTFKWPYQPPRSTSDLKTSTDWFLTSSPSVWMVIWICSEQLWNFIFLNLFDDVIANSYSFAKAIMHYFTYIGVTNKLARLKFCHLGWYSYLVWPMD